MTTHKLPPYHLGTQNAAALLQPLSLTLAELTRRTEHYLERLQLSAADQAALVAAHTALQTAHDAVTNQWQGSQEHKGSAQ